ncbi:hypothetical protein OGAPHI_002214 [Ogataea philodendri]|uniref:Uncharacterized protein n=1 Tax=Ogataea philodendri TaxID=1378263 RepID=A0A9P8PB16_9ASCO|nr:uncharacterized protein OGAPHI_002214 [Ogataea philodendri]KAH3668460.1 hypothetical protein OGAPHI_002214 [Ogataea philodendri]
MSLRIVVDEPTKKDLREKFLKCQSLFYLSQLEKSRIAADLLARSGSPSLDYSFGYTDLSISLTPIEVELILGDRFELFEYVRRLGRLRALKPYLLEFKNESFLNFLRARLRVYSNLVKDSTLTYIDGIGMITDHREPFNELMYQEAYYMARPSNCRLILGFEKLVEYVCRLAKTYGNHDLAYRMVFGYDSSMFNNIGNCIRMVRPFEMMSFQILDFEDHLCNSGFAMVSDSDTVGESLFRYVLHLQDCATKYNFLMPLESSSYASVGNFLNFLFLTFREPRELVFDGLETAECKDFIKMLGKILNIKVSLQVDNIKFTNGSVSLHLETLISASMKFFHSRNWAPQLSVICKILNNLRLYGYDHINEELGRFNPAELLFNSNEDLRELIGESDLDELIRLWEENEKQLEETDQSIIEVDSVPMNGKENGHKDERDYESLRSQIETIYKRTNG